MAMNPTIIKVASALHSLLYRSTGGRIGGSVAGGPVALLITTGRRSGRRRTAPLLYLPDGDNTVVVASNGGHDEHPAWYLNLKANPEAEVRIGNEKRRVRAETADSEERARLWPLLLDMYSNYDEYQKSTDRRIPVVILRPETQDNDLPS